MFRYLPEAVRTYLAEATAEHGNASERGPRVRAVRNALLKSYSIEQVADALEALSPEARTNPANIELKLYALCPENRVPEPIAENYTPPQVALYDPDAAVYDRLLPVRTEEAAAR